MDLPIYRSIYLSIGLSIIWIYLSTYLPGYSTRLLHFSKLTTSNTQHFCETSSFCEVDHIKQKAILRDLLLFLSWPHQKRNNSARVPSFLNLTTSKTKQFCETSSFFTLDNIKTQRILRDFLQKWKVDCSADGLVPMRFAIFPLHLFKVLRLPRKVRPGHTKCCTCHAKSSSQNWRSDAPKCNPSQEISARTS